MAYPAPRSLSPTRISSFTSCPLAFRYRTIDHLPEPPSPHAVKGTLVHKALEIYMWERLGTGRSGGDGCSEALDVAWDEVHGTAEFSGLALDREGESAFRSDAALLLRNYFALETPRHIRVVGVELRLEGEIDGVPVRGIIDRLDIDREGNLVVIDYKTGRAPPARYEKARLSGVYLYAMLCEQNLGRLPREVRLLHLREPMSIRATPTAQTVRAQERRSVAVWEAIGRACDEEDFRPRPSGLCAFCHFKPLCPAFGGAPPPEPA